LTDPAASPLAAASKVIIFGNKVITPPQVVLVQLYSCFASDKSISWQVFYRAYKKLKY
jgi:hypothetical protein